jgi:aryl-alcohol dehydrogenase-like predicted oxidoreductase
MYDCDMTSASVACCQLEVAGKSYNELLLLSQPGRAKTLGLFESDYSSHMNSSVAVRPLGSTNILVSPVAMGCWPIAGVTSLDVNERDSLATLEEALACGINFLDTAYCYGLEGESERMIGRVLRGRRDAGVIATKGGIHFVSKSERILDSSPVTLRKQCETSLHRLGMDFVDLYYLHAPDGVTPVEQSAEAILQLQREGKTRAVGASNLTFEQLQEFHAVCPLDAYQPPYNMLQRQIEQDVLPWCQQKNISLVIYWPLLKGLLAGKLPRDFVFQPGDGRAKYPMFQGEEWRRNQDFLDRLREIAAEAGKTVAQLVVNWTIHQPGVTSALCGAKRPEQIRETAGAMGWQLSAEQLQRIDAALIERGEPLVRGAV